GSELETADGAGKQRVYLQTQLAARRAARDLHRIPPRPGSRRAIAATARQVIRVPPHQGAEGRIETRRRTDQRRIAARSFPARGGQMPGEKGQQRVGGRINRLTGCWPLISLCRLPNPKSKRSPNSPTSNWAPKRNSLWAFSLPR